MGTREIRLGVSPLTETVYAGKLLKDGITWAPGKQDVTSDFIKCVLDKFGPHVDVPGCECEIQTSGGDVDFVITVTRASAPKYSQLKAANKELLEALEGLLSDYEEQARDIYDSCSVSGKPFDFAKEYMAGEHRKASMAIKAIAKAKGETK